MNTLSHLLPYCHLRVEQIHPVWPTKGAILPTDDDAYRESLLDWSDWVSCECAKVREVLWSDRFNYESLDPPLDSSEEAEYKHLLLQDSTLNEFMAVLLLPTDVVYGARKRLFGAFAPQDADCFPAFSQVELMTIAGAFWSGSNNRMDYLVAKATAEEKAKRSKRVANVFASLRRELD